MKQRVVVGLIILAALLFRVAISPNVFHADLISQAGWGEHLYMAGSKEFYSYNIWAFSWPNHPPLTTMYYGWSYGMFRQVSLSIHHFELLLKHFGISINGLTDFVLKFDLLASPEHPYPLGYFITLKLIPILFDVMLGCLMFFLAVRNKKNGILYLIIYLISPFSWYLSALWGQTDPVAGGLVLLAFLILRQMPFFSVLMFFVGLSMKPTSVFLLPLYIFLIFSLKVDIKKIILGTIVCGLANYWIFNSFTNEGVWHFTFTHLMPRIFDRPPRLTTNAYNFWHIWVLDKAVSDKTFLANVWSWIFYGLINIWGFKYSRKGDTKSIVGGIFIIGFGSWLFLTNMLDRYSFIGIVSGLMVTIYYPKLIWSWFVLSIIYWLNLFKGWWYPTDFVWLKYLLTTNDNRFGFWLSLINFLVYIQMMFVIIRSGKNVVIRNPRN